MGMAICLFFRNQTFVMAPGFWWLALSMSFSPALQAQSGNLFESDEVLTITLSGPLNELLRDRTGDPRYFDVTLSYTAEAGGEVEIPLRARTRGNFRRMAANCEYPPLLLNFSKNVSKNSIFSQQDKLKLVTPCRGDGYVVREYMVYTLYNQITPLSFKARLVKVVLNDPALKSKLQQPFYGILLEEEDQMAERNKMVSIDRQLVKPERTQADNFLTMAVFQYLIGNTDWSVQYRQNIKLISPDTLARPVTVPYDFDHAGIVGAPYAKPAEALQLSSTRQRRFRGYCISDMAHFEKVITHYNHVKEELYSVYTSGTLLDENYVKSTLKYLDDFYKTINDSKKVKEEFQYPCRKDGTGNVVIRGLKN
jgi:hypothetical protein